MYIYIHSMMHLTGYSDVSLDDLKAFRQLGSKTPGHPENTITAGIEVSVLIYWNNTV